MSSLQIARGPDDEGYWRDPGGYLQLGFRRLSIIDLTSSGAQPMRSGDGRSVIVFNGEVYNYVELRQELASHGVKFRSTSDTEVVLECLNRWGPEAIDRFNGMFAFAWYRIQERTLMLARDHAGIKPLYYYIHPSRKGVAFASQFNALLHTPWGEPGSIRQDVLRLYLQLHYVPSPFSLLENTYQLEPGEYIEFKADGSNKRTRWWSMPRDPEPDLSGEKARQAVYEALCNAVHRQLRSDVPLGVFLSGGIDSPLVTAVARQETDSRLKSFIIGNPGWGQDEAELAVRYGKCLDVDYQVDSLDDGLAVDALPDVMAAQHEPFGDFSIIPTLFVSRFARQQVSVSLSGDGGDELFFGYERPLSLLRNGGDFRFPWLVRAGMYGAAKYLLGRPRSPVIAYKTPGDYYLDVNCRMKDDHLSALAPGLPSLPRDFTLYQFESYQGLRNLANYSRWVEYYGQMQRCLKKVDMASMYHSLEVRVPVLDREVIEASLRIDPFDHMQGKRRKAVLVDLLGRHVPENIVAKQKRGFAVPLASWLRGQLRPMVEDTLFSESLYPDGLFQKKAMEDYWNGHLSGKRDNKWGIWTILSLQWWAKRHLRQASCVP